MKVEIVGSKGVYLFLLLFICSFSFGQYIAEGRVVFERRTNLEKRFKGVEMRGFMRNADLKKPKIDEFELIFNESQAIFRPIESDLPDDRSWFTMKNTSFQDFKANERSQEFSFMGTSVFLVDSLKDRTWNMTESKREIAGYNCRQAFWQANDSIRIYAWYAEELLLPAGPETFNGLPGTILGLAIEDGGVVYFAKSVERKKMDLSKEKPKGKEKDTFNENDLRALIKERFGSMGSMADRFILDMFMW